MTELKEAYLAMHKASGIKVGDRVRVLRGFGKGEMGCAISDAKEQQIKSIGNTYLVESDRCEYGFGLDNHYRYPFFVLEKLAPQHKAVRFGEYEAKVTADTVTIPREQVEAVISAMNELCGNTEPEKPKRKPLPDLPPLPSGAVYLGRCGEFQTSGFFEGWGCHYGEEWKWDKWSGDCELFFYAAPADSKIAKLNGLA